MVTLFVLGILAALVVDELTGYSPGGIIVPAFLVLSLHVPAHFVLTVGVGIACFLLGRLVSRYMLLYGRRRFAFLVLTGLILKASLDSWLPLIGAFPFGLGIVGYIIPGILADNITRQGLWPTLGSMLLATALARLLTYGVLGW